MRMIRPNPIIYKENVIFEMIAERQRQLIYYGPIGGPIPTSSVCNFLRDKLHILLGNERPDSTATRAQKDDRTLSNFVKRKPLPVPNKVCTCACNGARDA